MFSSMDRLQGNELRMTQELIANMLGVRREGVTLAAGELQAAGLIHYSRGRITVLDRPKLEARVCECYAVVKRESDRLLSARARSLATFHDRDRAQSSLVRRKNLGPAAADHVARRQPRGLGE